MANSSPPYIIFVPVAVFTLLMTYGHQTISAREAFRYNNSRTKKTQLIGFAAEIRKEYCRSRSAQSAMDPEGQLYQAEQLIAASQAGLATDVRARYSSFSCTGTPWGRDLHVAHGYGAEPHKFHPFRRSCRFNHICLNHTSLEYVFFQPDPTAADPLPLFYDFTGQPHYTFPEDFVNIGNSEVAPYVFWSPKVVRGAIPVGTPFHETVHVLIAPNVLVGNLGHALFDFLYLVFNTLQLFNVYTEDFQMVFGDRMQDYGNPVTEQQFSQMVEKFVNASDPERNIMMMISNNRVVTKEQLAARLPGALSCMSTLVTGTFEMEARNARVSGRAFRAAVVRHLKVDASPPLDHPVITVITKKGRRIIENTPQIVDLLRRKFPGAELVVLEGSKLAAMSMADQVRAMSRTNIFFSPGGGTASIAIFLPPGATAIIVNHWEMEFSSSAQMDATNFNNLDYLDFVYFPVTLEDYEGTSDRPDCEWDEHLNRGGTLKQCNVMIKDLRRVENVFTSALMRWAAAIGLPFERVLRKPAGSLWSTS